MKRSRKSGWPPLPAVLHGAGGPITITPAKSVKGEKGEDAFGTWEPGTRTIEIDSAPDIEHQWRTFYHESMHSILSDSGLSNLLTDESEEAMCDAYSTARIAEMRGLLNLP